MSARPPNRPVTRRRGAFVLLSLFFGVAALVAPSAFARPSVAVVGVHGGEQGEEELRRLHDELVAGLKASEVFDVVAGDALALRFEAERTRVIEHLWAAPARQSFEEGRVLYENAQPDRAIEAFRRASALLEEAAQHLQDGRLPVDVQLYLGLSYAAMNQLDDARESFTEVVRLSPGRVLDENEFPPRVVSIFEAVRAEATARDLATVRVEGATGRIWLDGRFAGTAPGELPGVTPGYHVLVVDGGEGGRSTHELNLAPGAEQRVVAVLKRPTLARGADDPWESARSPFTRRLVEEIGRVAGTDFVALAAFDPDGNLRLALWSARASHGSAAVVASLGGAPGERGAFVRQLAERVALYAREDGTIKSDRVVAELVPMRPGRNPVLVDLLFGTRTAPPVTAPANAGAAAKKKTASPAGAIVAIVAGGLGAAIAGTVAGIATREPTVRGGAITVRFP